jgi:hypothetical protein
MLNNDVQMNYKNIDIKLRLLNPIEFSSTLKINVITTQR